METPKNNVGTVLWMDLTVPDAQKVRDFYSAVVGWQADALPMDGYDDYVMKAPGTGAGVAGICHARGDNKNQPPQWLIYITVADLDASLRTVGERGGKIVVPRRGSAEMGWFAVIEDPAGAVATLFQPAG